MVELGRASLDKQEKTQALIYADVAGDLELVSGYAKYEGRGLREAREALDRHLIRQALARHKGNITKAAADLGVSRPTLYELMDKLGVGEGRSRA